MATLALALGVVVAQPFVNDLIPSFGPESLTGTYFGLFSLASGVAAALGNALIGWVNGFGTWPAPLLCVAIGLVGAGGVTRLHRRGALDVRSHEEVAR